MLMYMSNPIGTIEQLLASVDSSDRNYDVEKIKKAYEVAEKAHKDSSGSQATRISAIQSRWR